MGPGLARLVLISRRGPASLGSFLRESISGSPTKYLGLPSIQPRTCRLKPIRECHTTAPDHTASTPAHLYNFHPEFPEEDQLSFLQSFLVLEDVVTEDEEVAFMKEMEPHLKRHIYEKVTSSISNQTSFFPGPLGWCYSGVQRNGEKNFQLHKCTSRGTNEVSPRHSLLSSKQWSLRGLGFSTSGKESRTLPYAHVLDLADWGHIKPHIDSSRVSFHVMMNSKQLI